MNSYCNNQEDIQMFTWLNKQGVKSENKGFIVQFTGRFSAEYRESFKKIEVELENGIFTNGKFSEIIKSDSFSKWDDGTNIPEKKQKEILKNFIEAMDFMEIRVIVE